jgi:hypothetical protein
MNNPGAWIWVLIPIAGIVMAHFGSRHRFEHRERMERLKAEGASQSDMARVLAKLEQMEQRLVVLEKLVTDPSVRLAQEIDQLRDRRP